MADNAALRQIKKKKRPSRFLPARPKKPTTGYGIYLKDFFQATTTTNAAEAREIMRRAATSWQALSQVEKEAYNERANPDKEVFTERLTKFNNQKQYLKRPPSSYALFVKELWQGENALNRNIGTMGAYASGLWTSMTEEAKAGYRERARTIADEYRLKMHRLITNQINISSIGDPQPMEANDDGEEEEALNQ